MEKFGSQLYIEGEKNSLFIYFHLQDFKIRNASEILKKYIENFREHDIEKINISFCSKGVPGEHLSAYRKTNNRAIAKILKGVKCISACFQYKENITTINRPKALSRARAN
ncbi:MAG TPA: hypothetical protein PK605_00925 [Ignavibacteria bacterium]|nr:hypothetical protein [Ignavibacteria bacterium]HAX49437.1 hypothetical protein [Bacteroidota bacterium]HRE09711.1 hypothetical protein [Ignavibacteria bacterium]HRF65561.1 hypothetical protein [Ignavibacteria bacterium]HRJ02943.1 hypothetical protein [Ignavibacteria bacterium]